MKQHRITALMLSAACLFCGVTADFPASAENGDAEVQTVRTFLDENKFRRFYEYGCAVDPAAMQASIDNNSRLSASWEEVSAPLVSMGYSTIEYNLKNAGAEPASLRHRIEEIRYSGNCRHSGNSQALGIHGWLSEPRAEFYVIENQIGSFSPNGDQKGYCGQMKSEDGTVYWIYQTEKIGKTPFAEHEPYLQYWSVRKERTFDTDFLLTTPLENHLTAWAMLGMELGVLEQVDVQLASDPRANFPENGFLTLNWLNIQDYVSSERSKFTLWNAGGGEVTALRPGDLNTDGKITREDLDDFQYYVKKFDFFDLHITNLEKRAADMNGDLKIDARDKTLLKRYLLNPPQAAVQTPGILPGTDRKLLFSDEFNGNQLNKDKWRFETGNWKLDRNGEYVTNGWGNNEQQFYTDHNASVKDGVLTIAARHESITDDWQGSYDYTSAKLTTHMSFGTVGGRVEVRARCDAGKSLWPAIWMLPVREEYGGWAASGEIDIMEGWGSRPEEICGTIHFGNAWPDNQYLTADYQFPAGTSATDWHVYAVEWKKDCIEWYVDGQLYSTQKDWFSSNFAYPAPFDQKFYLILNLAVGGTFDGIDGIYADTATFADGEKQFQIDYVRVYAPEEEITPQEITQEPLELYLEGTDASLKNSGSSAEFTINSVGEKEYAVMGLLRRQYVGPKSSYILTFKADSSVPRDMVVTVEDSEYNRYLEKKIRLTPEQTAYTETVSFPDYMQADIKFQLGNIGDAAALGTHTVRLYDVDFHY